MNQRLLKEARSLLPVWIVAQILVLIPVVSGRNLFTEIGFTFFALAIALIAVSTFGVEFDRNTMELLLSQPVSRLKVWGEKLAMLALALSTVYVTASYWLFPLCTAPDLSPPGSLAQLYEFAFAFLLCALGGGTFWTLVLKNNIAALTVSLIVPLTMMAAIDFIGSLNHIGVVPAGWHLAALFTYAAFATLLSLLLFRSLQTTATLHQDINIIRNSDAQIRCSEKLHRTFRWLPGSWPQLFVKELHLHVMNFLTVGALTVVWITLLTLHAFKVRYMPLAVQGLATTWLLIIPLMIGAASIAEERWLGILHWQQVQPPSRKLQWFIKLFTCLLLTVILGWALPTLLEHLSAPLLPTHDFQVLIRWQGWIVLVVALAGYSGSSLAKDFLSAALYGIAIALIIPAIITLGASWLFHEFWDIRSEANQNHFIVFGYVATVIYLGVLMGFGYHNYVWIISGREWLRKGFRAAFLTLRASLVACLILASFYGIENGRGQYAWKKYHQEHLARGAVLDWSAFIPPAVPSDRNFAEAPLLKSLMVYNTTMDTNVARRVRALNPYPYYFQHQPELTLWPEGKKIDLADWQVFYRGITNFPPGSLSQALSQKYLEANSPGIEYFYNFHPAIAPQPTSPAEDVLLGLSPLDPEFTELKTAALRPEARFPLSYNNPKMMLSHLGALMNMAGVPELRAVSELALGRSEAALEDIKLNFRFAQALKPEPFLASQWVRGAILEKTLQPVWEGLADHRWTDAQLSALQRELSSINLIADHARAFEADNMREYEYFAARTTLSVFRDWISEQRLMLTNGGSQRPLSSTELYLMWSPRGWVYQNELLNRKQIETSLLPALRVREETMDVRQFKSNLQKLNDSPPRFYDLPVQLSNLTAAYERWMAQCAGRQTYIHLALIACALERYRLAHSALPESLDELSPQYLTRLPTDVINGQPLKYRRTKDDQFVLYSIGWDERDNSGRPVNSNTFKGQPGIAFLQPGDWVWRYPAKN